MGRVRYLKYKEHARHIVHTHLVEWNRHYQLPVKKVFIKNHKSRWGSCSERGNLNFNYRLVFLPPHLQAYLVIHELCHLAHFNHGPEFWALVAQTVPSYKRCRREIRQTRLM
ncbi:MAG: M48 family metallopeptidase [Candidatus Adlerbacteria bacterium]|nr:M48 family metallopeptidase [Candidatus Adlerbacteria bacterium]MDZ4226416.1 M48 family metallopeptidase [Patescibacteria group bacterium]